jgi:pyruvate dehydrogenase E1 component alpha subunit
MGTALKRAAAITELYQRAGSYAMPGVEVDGQDVVAVKQATDAAVARAREGAGPSLLEIRTFRYVGHSMSDAASGTYRSKEELDASRQRDPIALLETRMRELGMLDDAGVQQIEAEVAAQIADAVKYAEESPEPEPEQLWADVYAPEPS